jgi:predicted Zn-dependent protease
MAFRVGQADAMAASGATNAALQVYADAIRLFPRNGPLTTSYAETLIAAGKPAEAHELLLDLLNNVPPTAPQLRLIARAANAEGDVANAYFYMSYYYVTIGNLPLAIGQVRLALETPGSNEVDRARFRSRLDQLIEYLPDEQRELATTSPP